MRLIPEPRDMLKPKRADFVADHGADFVRECGIPCGGHGFGGGKRGCIAAFGSGTGDTDNAVGHLKIGNAEAGDAGDEAEDGDGAGERTRFWSASHDCSPAGAMKELDLFVEGHFLDDHVGAGIWRERLVGPRVVFRCSHSRELGECGREHCRKESKSANQLFNHRRRSLSLVAERLAHAAGTRVISGEH